MIGLENQFDARSMDSTDLVSFLIQMVKKPWKKHLQTTNTHETLGATKHMGFEWIWCRYYIPIIYTCWFSPNREQPADIFRTPEAHGLPSRLQGWNAVGKKVIEDEETHGQSDVMAENACAYSILWFSNATLILQDEMGLDHWNQLDCKLQRKQFVPNRITSSKVIRFHPVSILMN